MRADGGVSLADIVALLGPETAMVLARSQAGRRLYIPTKRSHLSKLVTIIGLEAARKLCEAAPGAIVELAIEPVKVLVVHQLRAKGMSIEDIAAELLMSRTGVKQFLKRRPLADASAEKPANDTLQLDLFSSASGA